MLILTLKLNLKSFIRLQNTSRYKEAVRTYSAIFALSDHENVN